MKILFDITHPAHLHFFKNVIKKLQDDGHEVLLTGRDKDILIDLAEIYNMDIIVFGKAKNGILNLFKELIYRKWKLFKIIRKFKPDAMMAIAGTYIGMLGWLTRTPAYVFYDTEHADLSNIITYPFAKCVYVPKCYRKKIRWRHKRYNGYHELAYLHPNYFTPDISVLNEVDLNENDIFSVVRFVGWGAHHDFGLKGFTLENKKKAIEVLNQFGKVFISCEGELPAELENYRLRIDVTKIHSLMAYASLVFGESATMCSEASVLGVPNVYVDPVGRGYTDEQEKDYGLVSNFTSENQNKAIERGKTILENYDKQYWRQKGKQLVDDKIDVTEMIYKIAIEKPYT